jgi:hypothetical protein
MLVEICSSWDKTEFSHHTPRYFSDKNEFSQGGAGVRRMRRDVQARSVSALLRGPGLSSLRYQAGNRVKIANSSFRILIDLARSWMEKCALIVRIRIH